MKVTLTSSIPRLIVFASALLSTAEVVGQGYPVPGAEPSQFSQASPFSTASYVDPSYPTQGYYGYEDGYPDQRGVPLPTWREAANAVMETTVGYAVSSPFGPRLSVDNIFGDRMGVDGNDYSILAFLPWHIDPGRNLVFAIARGTSTDLGDFAGSFGVGQRMYFEDLNRMFGGSIWYDIDDTHSREYYRGGGQIEYIGRYMEVRGGADLVIDSNRNVLAEGITNDQPFFGGNNILFNGFNTSEYAYNQGYIEAGGPLPFLGRYGVNGYAGAYFLWHDDDEDSLGWSARFFANLTRDVQVNVRFTRDDVFGANTSANVSLSLPNGGLKQLFRPSPTAIRGQSPDGYVDMASYEPNGRYQPRPTKVAYRMGNDVIREFRLPVLTKTVIAPLAAINPADGKPYCVIHVDPNASLQGIGTFESPFMTMEAARLGNDPTCEIIRVVPRSDGSGTNLAVNAPFVLFPDQRLLGSSVPHTIVTTLGIFPLPGFTGPGPGPLVTNAPGGDVIGMVSRTEVSGLIIDGGGTGNGIVGNPIGFNINRNTIQNSVNGIRLLGVQGVGLVDANTIVDSVVDGAQISVTGGNMLDLTATGNTITGSGDDGADVTATGSLLMTLFTGNGFGDNADMGLEMTSTGGSTVMATLTGNTFGEGANLPGNGVDGFFFTADSGTADVVIGGPLAGDGNVFIGNGDDGVDFNLTGTALATLLAQNNTTISGAATVGLNFTGTSFGDFPTGFPPDTMGSVGPNHIVELINNAYAIYDKGTGNLISRVADEQFWTDAGLAIVNSDTFDPRIIYDPQSGRWFATAIDRLGATSNTIYIAVSNTSDPTMGFQGVQFQADSTGMRFNDFDMLGLDADGLYITTNNFLAGTFSDTSLYSVPKADLLAATPSLANMTAIENQPAGTLPFRTQAAVDFGPSDGRAALLSASSGAGVTLNRLDVLGSTGPGATLTAPTAIPVPPYVGPVNADQPGPKANLDTGNAGFASNVFEVGDSLWAVQSITNLATGNVAIRWYEIDETNNAVLQSGTISDPNLDFYYPSIAAAANGNVVIGYSASSDNQFVSSFASVGRTQAGVTAFDPPIQLQAGVSDYERLDNIGRNRWGDYSATVIDPSDPSSFWTFQEFVDGTDSYAIQITQLTVGGGGNTGDGISITATGSSVLTNATIDRNRMTDNGEAGLRMRADGAALIANAVITNNIATRNETGAFLTSTAGGTINTMVDGNQFDLNTGSSTGFYGLATGTGSVVNVGAFTNNTASSNTSGNGLRFEATAGGVLNLAGVTGNTANSNGLNGAFIRAGGVSSVVAGAIGLNGGAMNTFNANNGAGIRFEAIGGGSILGPGAIGNFLVLNNTIGAAGLGNALGGVSAIADSNIAPPSHSVLNLAVGGPAMGDGNVLTANMDFGIGFSTRTFAEATVLMQNNVISATVDNPATANPTDPMGDGIFLDRGDVSLLTAMVLSNSSTTNENDGMRVLSSGDDPTNPSQPMSGTPNIVTFNMNDFSQNMRNGASFQTMADSVLVANGMLNLINNNVQDGINVTATEASGFGDPAGGVFSVFDGMTITGNMTDGLDVNTTGQSRTFLRIQSSDAVGLTEISGNFGDGVDIEQTSSGMSNYVIESDPLLANTMFRTLITGNGTMNGGNGVQLTNRASASLYTVQRTDITGNIVDMTGAQGDGVAIVNSGGSPTYTVGSPIAGGAIGTLGLGNTIQVNTGDGLDISQTGGSPTYDVAENVIGARLGELVGGNLSHGVNIAASGGLAPVATFLDNDITRNVGRGANINVTGTLGARVAATGGSAQFIFDDGGTGGNVISANGLEGIFYNADPQVAQDRTIQLDNTDEPAVGMNDLPPNLWDNRLVAFPPANYFPDFLNLTTVNNTFFAVRNNTIQSNGTRGVDSDTIGGVDGDGVYLRVGTSAYVAADIQGNAFGGNLQDDFRTESFISAPNAVSVDNMGANTFDMVVLKDTAQLDLRFGVAGNINTGNQINVTNAGATHTNDPLTGTVFAALFQVDDGPGLNANNSFIQFAVPQNISTAFGDSMGAIIPGAYHQRSAADPFFPNFFFPDAFPGATIDAPFLP